MVHKVPDIDENFLLSYLLGRCDPEEARRVEEWLAADPSHREEMSRLETLWHETGRVDPPPVNVDTDKAWKRFARRIDGNPAGEIQAAPSMVGALTLRQRLVALAAMIILLAGLAGIYRFMLSGNETVEYLAAAKPLPGVLPDGTRFVLDRDSRLTVGRFSTDGPRRTTLEGRALFRVQTDNRRPFYIETPGFEIRVVGTVFTVQSGLAASTVSVSEGAVRFYPSTPGTESGQGVLLVAGEQASWSTGSKEPGQIKPAEPDAGFWADRSLGFRGMALKEVFPVLERHYQVRITAADSTILQHRLTADFSGEAIDAILGVITGTFDLQYRYAGGSYFIFRQDNP